MLQKLRNYLFVTTPDGELYLVTRYDYALSKDLALYVIYLHDKTSDQFKVIGQIETPQDILFDAKPYAHSPIVLIAYGLAYGLITLSGTKQSYSTTQLEPIYREYRQALKDGKIDIGYIYK